MKRRLQKFGLVAVLAAVSLLLGSRVRAGDCAFVEQSAMAGMSVFVATVFAVIVFFLQLSDGIRSRAIDALRQSGGITPAGEKYLKELFESSIVGLRDNAAISIAGMAGLFAAALWAKMDLPLVHWPCNFWISKVQFVHAVSIFTVSTALWSAWDTCKTMFTLRRIDVATAQFEEKQKLAKGQSPDNPTPP